MSNFKTVEDTVVGLGYELVECERASHGLLRVYIDRVPGHVYVQAGEFVTVEDCEVVNRQLQYALEVAAIDYARLEVSSPGLDRPLRTPAHFERFLGEQVEISLKEPFEGRKKYEGLLTRPQADESADAAASTDVGWQLIFKTGAGKHAVEQVLGFQLNEVRDARLVPVVDFKGRGRNKPALQPAASELPELPETSRSLNSENTSNES